MFIKLQEKHPKPNPVQEGSLIVGPVNKIEPIIYSNIDSSAIQKAARLTKGGAGPSNIDSDMWKTLLCAKSGGNSIDLLSEAISKVAQRLATECVDPSHIDSFLNCRLIPLDKNPGIRPIGIGEVIRRIIGKAISVLTKSDVVDAMGPLQLSAGQNGGAEAAVHAMRDLYEDTSTEGLLFVDAENAFNSMNRLAALHNVQRICPVIATFLINCFRCPCKLFLSNGKICPNNFIWSSEGTTQGDNMASSFYSAGILQSCTTYIKHVNAHKYGTRMMLVQVLKLYNYAIGGMNSTA